MRKEKNSFRRIEGFMRTGINVQRSFLKSWMYSMYSKEYFTSFCPVNGHRNTSGGLKVLMQVE